MATSDIDICTQALAQLGQPAISSFSDENPNSVLCANTYPDFRLAMLTVYPWRFATTERQLVRIANKTPIRFEFAFQLPSDRISVPEAFYADLSGTRIKNYEILGDEINIDFDECFAKYALDISEPKWPPTFTRFVILAYAADIAKAVTEEANLARDLIAKAWGTAERRDGGAYRNARMVDSRGSEQRSMLEDGGPLIQARRSGLSRNFFGIIE